MEAIKQDLLEALSEAGLDSELVSDVMEASLLHGLTCASISNLTPDRAAELLFLTTEEVATLIAICKAKSGMAGMASVVRYLHARPPTVLATQCRFRSHASLAAHFLCMAVGCALHMLGCPN